MGTKPGRRGAAPATSERLPSSVDGLDLVLGGGLLRRRVYLIEGPPGAGKTVLACQLCFGRARDGECSVYVTLLSESHTSLLENLKTLEFFDPKLTPRRVTFVSGYQALEEGGLDELSAIVRATVQRRRARLVVIDTLATPIERAPSAHDLRKFIRELGTFCSLFGCTLVCLLPTGGTIQADYPEAVVDGIVLLDQMTSGLRTQRTVEVLKYRGSEHLAGKHTFDISRRGVRVFPRIEARFAHAARAEEVRGRLLFGIEALDAMLHGGVIAASTTAIIGAPGSGKTILGLQFLAEGARLGEPCLYFGFYETPPRLCAKAEGIGLPVGRYEREGLIELIWQPPLEYSVDELAEQLLEAVGRRNVKRLFIDGIDAFRTSSVFPERLPRFFAALTNELRAQGVTTLLSEEAVISAAGVQPADQYFSAQFENLISLRYIELRSQLYRLISILKVRESDYDSSIREFRITGGGIELASSFESAEAILSGHARPGRSARRPPGGTKP